MEDKTKKIKTNPLAGSAEIAEQNRKLEALVDDIAGRMAEHFSQTIDLLGAVVILLERYYEGSHSRFVADKSAAVAKDLGMNEVDVFTIHTAGLLHDIGKLGFSDLLLSKHHQAMNPRDYDLYTKHCRLGREILRKHEGFADIAEVVYQHHEKQDGSGFPNHLKEDKIHPMAQIISVVDYYHSSMHHIKRDKTLTPTPSIKLNSKGNMVEANEKKYASVMNYIHSKKKILFNQKIVDSFTHIMYYERLNLGRKNLMRVPVNKVDSGMVFAEDYYTSFGMLIAAKGEEISGSMKKMLLKFAEAGQIPHKILVVK